MSKTTRIKKGLNINLKGKAEAKLSRCELSETYAIKPPDFEGLTPKLAVKSGQEVKAGTPLFFDKYHPEILFTSPVSGIIEAVNRGERRRILEVVVRPAAEQTYEEFLKGDPSKMLKEEIKENLLKSGLWPNIIQRPYGIIANPENTPKAIFISAFDTAPLAVDYDFVVKDQEKDFQTGIDALKKLTNADINVSIGAETKASAFLNAKNVILHTFTGPHPAGLTGTQINKVSPINKGEIVWTVGVQGVISIGKLFNQGKLDATRIIALAGSEVDSPCYFKTLSGTQITPIIKNHIISENPRFISGNVLTGERITSKGYLGYYDASICAIPEGDEPELFGWALPGFGKFSASRTFFSWLTPNKNFVINTNMQGGERPFVVTGEMEKVMPLDILPMQLLKAIIINDIDMMEQLGIYEVIEEDFALCEFISTSKIPIQSIVRKGLDAIRKEFE